MNNIRESEFDVGDIVTHKNMAGLWKIAVNFPDLSSNENKYILVSNHYFAVIKAKLEDLRFPDTYVPSRNLNELYD